MPRGEGIAASGGGLALLVCAVAAGMALQCALLAGRATATPRAVPLTAQRERAVWPVHGRQAPAPIDHAVPATAAVESTGAVQSTAARRSATDAVVPAATRTDAREVAPAMQEAPARTTPTTAGPAPQSEAPETRQPREAKPGPARAESSPAPVEATERLVSAMGTPISTPGLTPTEEDVEEASPEFHPRGGRTPEPEPEDDTTADGDSGGTQVVVIGPARARTGEQLTFQIGLEGAVDVAHAPLRVDFDPAVLQFAGAHEGTAFSMDGVATQFLAVPDSSGGRVEIALSRMPPARGIHGGGALCTLTFTAIGTGTSPIVISRGRLMDTTGRAVSFRRSDAHVFIE
jgi:hypothetical protein